MNNGGYRFRNDRSTVFLGTQENKGSIESPRIRARENYVYHVNVDVHS